MSILHHLTFPELCASNEIDNVGFVSNLLFCEMNECKRLLGTLEYLPCFPMMAKWLPNPLPSSIQTELNGGKNGQFLRLAFTLLFYIYTNSVEVIGAENHQKCLIWIFAPIYYKRQLQHINKYILP